MNTVREANFLPLMSQIYALSNYKPFYNCTADRRVQLLNDIDESTPNEQHSGDKIPAQSKERKML